MDGSISRRGVIVGAASGVALSAGTSEAEAPVPRHDPAETAFLTLHVNGRPISLTVDHRASLLDALRENAGLMGTKKGCDRGACGACTVHIDGRRIVSCLTLASRCGGKDITTIEGLATDGKLHPVQAAFIAHDGFQCGYCTPGQIMEGHAGSDAEIREWMSGNICRCGAYPNIVAAVRQAHREG